MLNQLKFTIIFSLEYLDQILSTAVDVEFENDEDTISPDGTVCTFFYVMTFFTENILIAKFTVNQM